MDRNDPFKDILGGMAVAPGMGRGGMSAAILGGRGMPPGLGRALAEALMGEKEAGIPVQKCLDEAQDYLKRYCETEEFKPGDLVTWKDGMDNMNIPKPGEPVMVLDVFAPVRRESDGTPRGCEPADMRCITSKCGCGCGEVMVYAYDSHRMTHYKG